MTLPILVLALACGTDPASEPASELVAAPDAEPTTDAASSEPAQPPDPEALAIARARSAAQQVGKTLKGRVQESMAAGGPASTIDVCSVDAPALTAKIREESGVAIGRSSLRLRNPGNAGPDWVAAWLSEQGERPAEGVEGIARIDTVTGEDGSEHRSARVLVPIAVEAPCLACHGAPDALDPSVTERLASNFPDDRATGYALGDLRGALWAALAVD